MSVSFLKLHTTYVYPNKLGYIAIIRLDYTPNLGVYMYFLVIAFHFEIYCFRSLCSNGSVFGCGFKNKNNRAIITLMIKNLATQKKAPCTQYVGCQFKFWSCVLITLVAKSNFGAAYSLRWSSN